jgi:uncharacterized protein YggE
MKQMILRFGGMPILASALLLLGFEPAGFGQETSPPSNTNDFTRTISVTGHGEVNAKPDQATVRVGVEKEAATAVAAQEGVNAAMQKTIDAIKKLGINENAIQTAGLNLSPVYAPQRPGSRNEPPTVVGYRASNIVQIRVNDLQKLGDIIDAATSAGANRLEGVSFELKDDLKSRSRALQLAAQDAQAEANALASALSLKLGPVRKVYQVNANPPRPMYGGMALARAAEVSTPVEPGEVKVEASVTVEFQITGGTR